LLLLREELLLDGFSAPLYAEYLAHALAARLCSLTSTVPENSRFAKEKLPSPVFRRIIDRLESTPLERYDIDSLAAESGYSSGHFVRSFRASTGLPPHQFSNVFEPHVPGLVEQQQVGIAFGLQASHSSAQS
jgi:AraC family transcriptional regulator